MGLDMAKVVRLKIGELLKERNISVAQFTKKAHIAPYTARMLAKGYSDGIELNTIAKVCAALEIGPGEIFVYEEDGLN